MAWLKEVLVDIIVTLSILLSVFLNIEWLKWVVFGYTAILLLAKLIVFAGDNSLQLIRKTKTKAPDWFPHLLYGINVLVLLNVQWWYFAAMWTFIWLLSYIAQKKLKSGTKQV